MKRKKTSNDSCFCGNHEGTLYVMNDDTIMCQECLDDLRSELDRGTIQEKPDHIVMCIIED